VKLQQELEQLTSGLSSLYSLNIIDLS
jgi:hypothetical protein